ncbi:MAG: ATP-binding protein [Cyclobacteriaceae bacterium]
MISRQLFELIEKKTVKKAVIILGPRQTGKTTLINRLVSGKKEGFLFLNGDDPFIRQELTNANTEKIKQVIGKKTVVFIDEAQRIQNIGLTLKIITDTMTHVQLYVTGSSAFDLNHEVKEPLTGRKWEFNLYPISWKEFHDHVGFIQAKQELERRIIYGMYPEVINQKEDEIDVLTQLTSSYLYKDVLSIAGIRKPESIEKLLKALAFQIGNEVSYNELSNLIGIDKNTVNTYLDVLEKTYVIFRLQPFSRNLRNEISTTRKIYFYDTGLRNSLISNFSPLNLRQDKGALWENFVISERKKQNHYQRRHVNSYFWRTKQQQEIDYLEESDGMIRAFEFKASETKKVRQPKTFKNAYPDSSFEIISMQEFHDFIV